MYIFKNTEIVIKNTDILLNCTDVEILTCTCT